jgi:hypothetical protein
MTLKAPVLQRWTLCQGQNDHTLLFLCTILILKVKVPHRGNPHHSGQTKMMNHCSQGFGLLEDKSSSYLYILPTNIYWEPRASVNGGKPARELPLWAFSPVGNTKIVFKNHRDVSRTVQVYQGDQIRLWISEPCHGKGMGWRLGLWQLHFSSLYSLPFPVTGENI